MCWSILDVNKKHEHLGLKLFHTALIYVSVVFQLSFKQEDADWSRDMRGKRLITSVSLHNWVVIFFRRNTQQTQDFVQTLSRVGPPMGMMIDAPSP